MRSQHFSVHAFRYGVLDADGTIVDTVPETARIFARSIAARFSAVSTCKLERFYRESNVLDLRSQFCEALALLGIPFTDELIEELRMQFNAEFSALVPSFFPDAQRTVRTLARAGIRIFISSGARDERVKSYVEAGLLGAHVVVALGSSVIRKADGHIAHFAAHASVSVKEFAAAGFMVGDTEEDMRLARGQGLYAIGVLGTVTAKRLVLAGAQRTIRSIADLLKDRDF